LNRAETIWKIRRACVKANPKLWIDHGDILKRRVAQGIAVPTTLGVADILLAWQIMKDKNAAAKEGDEDAVHLDREETLRIISHWNVRKDDIDEQDDECISVLANLLVQTA
jgi:hypothetical protein